MEEETQHSRKEKTGLESKSEEKPPLERNEEEKLEFPEWFTEDQKERLKAEMKLPTPDWMRRFNPAPLFRGHDGSDATYGTENNGPDHPVDSKDRILTTTLGSGALLKSADGNKLIWTGTGRALGDWILQAWRDGKLKATSERNVLDQAAAHFVVQEESGKLRELSGKSLQQNLSNRRNIEGK